MPGMNDFGLEDVGLDVRDEPDGIVRVSLHGDFTEERARAIIGALRRVAESRREVLRSQAILVT
ncbi:hypothetical protein [Sorangium sp. So ce362]|uniref:hypothetical protein n=1 Tax=Sorangium sp. So ce362 TaxID=3133303 RepID=UPI003F5E1F56